MVEQTNLYALQFFDNPASLPPYSRFNKWYETSVPEMKAYVALQTAMGLCQKNSIQDYWSTYWLTYTPFTEVMSRDRYELLTSFLHFADNSVDRPTYGQDGYDPLWKIRPFLNICEPRYTYPYGPGRQLTIDESMIKYKGRIFFKQYLPIKPTPWGIKEFGLCEATTGFLLKQIIYCGKTTMTPMAGFSPTEAVCLRLTEGLENSGHDIYTDNYYSSPNLFREFENRGMGACGTVKPGRKNMPPELHPNQLKMNRGDEPQFMRSGNMVACTMHDTKRVSFISTIHTNNTDDKKVRSRGSKDGFRSIEKPIMGISYNKYKGGVDILDQKLGTYAFPHKAQKWYHTVYHRSSEVALVNGYIIYSKAMENEDIMDPKRFREKVIDGLLTGYSKKGRRTGRPSSSELPTRLVERHMIGQFQDPRYKPDCVVCSNRTKPGWKRKQTNYKCEECDLPMCFMPCHSIYHKYLDFKLAAGRMVYNINENQ